MLTRCPSCATHFRVTPAQLKARAGTVRCGQCGFVFNALETLADDPVQTFAETEPLVPPVQEFAAEESSSIDSDTGVVIEDSVEEFDIVTDGPVEAGIDDEADSSAAEPAPEAGQDSALSEDSLTEDYLVGAYDPLLHEPATPEKRWPWVLASVVAVIALLVQAAYYYRVELSVLRPGLRPALQAMCKPLHCEVPRPRNIDTLGIDASDLHPDPQQPGHLTLTATLRSKAPYAQEWPLLELTLTDVADRKLAVKHFSAADYLPKAKNDKGIAGVIAGGFPANGEIAVTLPLDVGDLPAAGYRLYIFYP